MIKRLRVTVRGFMYLLLVTSTAVFIYLHYNTNIIFYASSINTNKILPEVPVPGFLVHSDECQIPDIDPFDPNVKRFIKIQETLNCSSQYPSLTYTVGNQLIFDRHHEFSRENNLSCCYRAFYRPRITTDDNEIRFRNICVEFTNEATIHDEFVVSECSMDGRLVYKNFHSFIHDKPWVEMRNMRIRQFLKRQNYYSVMIIGVDSVSRLNMHRQLSKTLKFLKTKMDAVEMFGYNKVGDNTFPNLIPVLSGYHENELKFCRKNNDVIDNCPLIWKKFEEFGYRTFYAEDTPYISTFNYLKPGFCKQPTDYYFRPFILAAETDIGWNLKGNCYQCIGSVSETEAILSWLEAFVKRFNNRPYFSFSWINSLTHDFLNYGSYGDSYYAQFFERLHVAGNLKNTIVIFMSDHGMRWGPIRKTYIGKLEERLPVLLISLPFSFRKKYPTLYENLRVNTYRLITPFDLFATLNNILDPEENTMNMEYWSVPSKIAENYAKRAQSLFMPIPKNRSCSEAAITEHWCTCHQSETISVYDKEVMHVADYLVKIINSKLRSFVQCAKLIRKAIVSARIRAPTKHLKATKEYDIFDYSVTIRTVPGNGLFEATIRFVPKSHTHALLGDISRLNLYGNQSYCIQNANLRKYCYCK